MIKRQDIELLRIISAFAIVWYHSGAIGHDISYGGIVIFLIMSMYLAGNSDSSNGLQISRRAQRLLIPWLVWFTIYGIFNFVTHKPIIEVDNGIIAGILSGTSIHLWYMPFIFACLVLFDIARKYASKGLIAWASATLAIATLVATPIWRPASIELGYPIAQYAQALAGVFLGVFFSYSDEFTKPNKIFLLLVTIIAAAFTIPYEGVGIPYLIGIAAGLFLIFRIINNVPIIDFTFISQYTLGIYFVHILFLKVIQTSHLFSGIFLPVSAFLFSAFTIFAIRKISPKTAKYYT